jgi:hypothetical protein
LCIQYRYQIKVWKDLNPKTRFSEYCCSKIRNLLQILRFWYPCWIFEEISFYSWLFLWTLKPKAQLKKLKISF